VLLNGARGQHKRLGDGRVGFGLGDADQYLALAWCEISQRRLSGTRALRDQPITGCMRFLLHGMIFRTRE